MEDSHILAESQLDTSSIGKKLYSNQVAGNDIQSIKKPKSQGLNSRGRRNVAPSLYATNKTMFSTNLSYKQPEVEITPHLPDI
jgi:hypothetical protein